MLCASVAYFHVLLSTSLARLKSAVFLRVAAPTMTSNVRSVGEALVSVSVSPLAPLGLIEGAARR